jgi:hypothetical protein
MHLDTHLDKARRDFPLSSFHVHLNTGERVSQSHLIHPAGMFNILTPSFLALSHHPKTEKEADLGTRKRTG